MINRMKDKSLKTNTIFSTIKTLSSILFPLITFPYITRVLLTENVGKVNVGLSIVSYFALLASLGVSTYAIRECSAVRDDKIKLGEIASQIFTINVITTLISYLLLAITLMSFSKLENYRLLIAIQSVSILAATLGADWLNSALEDFKYISIRTVCFQLISLVLTFAFVQKPQDYINYAIISLVSSAGASITNIWYRQRYCKVRITSKIEWKKHLKPILFLFVMILSQTVFNNLDISMLGFCVGDSEAGIYTAAHKIMNVVNQLVASLLWVIMPRLSLYFSKNDYEKVNSLLRKVLGFYMFFGLPCAIGTLLISKDLILIAAGQDFAEASVVLQILMIGFLFMLVGGDFLGNAILLPSKREGLFMGACMISTLVNAVLNYLFIPFWGAKAAAATTALSELIILVILYFKRDNRIVIANKGKIILAPVIGCICIVVICLLCYRIESLVPRIVMSIIFSAIAYFLTNLLFKNEVLMEIITSARIKLKLYLNHKGR